MERRELLSGLLVAASMGALGSELEAQTTAPAAAAGAWSIKPLPFDPKTLKGISEKMIVSHHDNNYAGAVRRIPQIQQMLAGLAKNAPGFQLKSLKMEELIATNSAILHEQYFGNLGGDGKASGTLQQALAAQFGGFDSWEQDFRATGAALAGGSGWSILSYNFADGKLHNTLAYDHTDSVPFGRPILVHDMFEHAYHIDYGSNAAGYIDAFMLNVNWGEATRRFEEAKKISALLK